MGAVGLLAMASGLAPSPAKACLQARGLKAVKKKELACLEERKSRNALRALRKTDGVVNVSEEDEEDAAAGVNGKCYLSCHLSIHHKLGSISLAPHAHSHTSLSQTSPVTHCDLLRVARAYCTRRAPDLPTLPV